MPLESLVIVGLVLSYVIMVYHGLYTIYVYIVLLCILTKYIYIYNYIYT